MRIFAFIFCVLFAIGVQGDDGPQCKAPNGGGLQAVVEEFVQLVPKSDLIKIFMESVSKDPEVQEVMEYLSSEDFKNLALLIADTKEFVELMEFACNKLYIDMYYYFNQLGELLGIPPVTRPPIVKRSVSNRRPGLHGMLQDMLDVMPVDKIKALFEEKLKTDEYVKLAIETMKGETFKSIIHTLTEQEQYQKMLNDLRKMGVEVDEVLEVLRKFFGW